MSTHASPARAALVAGLAFALLCTASLSGCGAEECEPGESKKLVCEDETVIVRCRSDGTWRVAICTDEKTGDGGGKAPADLDYDPKTSVVVLDKTTGLFWQRILDGVKRTRADAGDYCAALVLNDQLHGKLFDWRLPDKDELETLVLHSTTNPAIDDVAFPDTPSAPFWTKTKINNKQGYAVDFEGGGTGYQFFDGKFDVRCVQ